MNLRAIQSKLINPTIQLLLIVTITTLLISTGSLYSSDADQRLLVTHSLWMHGSPQVDNYANQNLIVVIGKNGAKFVPWGIGQSLVMLPVDIIAHKLTDQFSIHEELREKMRAAIVVIFTFVPINVFSLIASFRFLQQLGFKNKPSILGALGLLFGTSFLAYAQIHQENSLVYLLTLSGYLLNLMWLSSNSTGLLFLGACALGFNILVRLTGVIDIISVTLFVSSILLIQTKLRGWNLAFLRSRSLKYLTVCGPVYLSFIFLDRLYHWIRFGSFIGTYQTIWAEQVKSYRPNLPESFPFSTSFSTGFWGTLFSPERSIFLFNPLLIITLILLVRYWKEISYELKFLIFSLIFLLLSNISFYATWYDWQGGAAWGPRFATVPTQLLSLLSIPLLVQVWFSIKTNFEKIVYKFIIFISILIQLSSVILDYNLESSQISILPRPIFVIVQRFINLAAIWTGNLDNWRLKPSNISSLEIQQFTTPVFLPWNAADKLPSQLSFVLEGLWFIGLAILVFLVSLSMIHLFLGQGGRKDGQFKGR